MKWTRNKFGIQVSANQIENNCKNLSYCLLFIGRSYQ